MKTAISSEMFRTAVIRQQPAQVLRDQKQILGVKLMQLGPLNAGDVRSWHVDQGTLDQVLQFASQGNRGLKARWTHPSMSDDGLGSYLGRWKNIRQDGDAVLGDLQLAAVAFTSPRGDLGSYVLDLAEEDPEAFGVSLHTLLAEEMFEETEEPAALRLAGLRAGDIVDSPAATRGGLFDAHSAAALPEMVSWVLNTHFADCSPEIVLERFTGLLSKHYHREIQAVTKETTAAEEQHENKQADYKAEALPYVEAFGAQGAQWFLEGKELLSCYQSQLQATQGKLEAAEALVEELKGKLAAVSLGEAEELSSDDHQSSGPAKPKSLKDVISISGRG